MLYQPDIYWYYQVITQNNELFKYYIHSKVEIFVDMVLISCGNQYENILLFHTPHSNNNNGCMFQNQILVKVNFASISSFKLIREKITLLSIEKK